MKQRGFMGLALGLVFSVLAEPAVVDFEQKWIFPKELGGLEYEASEKYEVADFGYRILYRKGDSFDAEVNIYDFGQDEIPDGYKGKGIDLIFESVEADLKLRLKRGEVDALKKLHSRVISKEGMLQFATVVSSYTETDLPNERKIQATYLTAVEGQFIRLRFTFDLKKENKPEKWPMR